MTMATGMFVREYVTKVLPRRHGKCPSHSVSRVPRRAFDRPRVVYKIYQELGRRCVYTQCSLYAVCVAYEWLQ